MSFELFIPPIILFLFGLLIGSFLNVLVDRIPRDETVISGRSHCEKCKHTLSFFDLVPFLSFLSLGGKCRYCKTKLSWYYPVSELATGAVFVVVYLTIGITSPLYLLFCLFISSCLIVIFFCDMKYGIIPDNVLYPAVVITLVFVVFFHGYSLHLYLFSALGAGLFFLFLFLLTRGKGMGFGDVKFAVLMGLLLGFPSIIYALYIAFLTGAFVSFILVLWRRKKIRSTIPFGPFLVLGTFLTFFFPGLINEVARMVLP